MLRVLPGRTNTGFAADVRWRYPSARNLWIRGYLRLGTFPAVWRCGVRKANVWVSFHSRFTEDKQK
jgi:hypothetical protein